VPEVPHHSPGSLWAYAYLVVPPQSKSRLSALRSIVDHENSAAERGVRTWNGRIVPEKRITHILIVSDSPEQNRGINQKLEAELNRIKAQFFLTNPMALPDFPDGMTESDAPPGNGRAALLPLPRGGEEPWATPSGPMSACTDRVSPFDRRGRQRRKP